MFVAIFPYFKSISGEVQKEIVSNLLYKSEGVKPSKDSVNSLDTEVAINKNSIMRLACSRWRNLVPDMKECWGRRAAWLNTLTSPGQFESLEEYNIHNGDIIESLTF